jgi:hypothetical protein
VLWAVMAQITAERLEELAASCFVLLNRGGGGGAEHVADVDLVSVREGGVEHDPVWATAIREAGHAVMAHHLGRQRDDYG